MVTNINIERECQHKILVKQDLILIITAVEFINNISEFGRNMKLASTNVSVINDNCGAQLSKIVGKGITLKEAYTDCLSKFNKNKNFFEEENKIFLCCSKIPYLDVDDLKDFNITRTFKFSWRNNENEICLLRVFVRNQNDNLIFIYDGDDKCRVAKTDREIIEFILANFNFDKKPEPINNKCKGKVFYPTTQEFVR